MEKHASLMPEEDRFGIMWSDPRFLEQFPLIPDCTNSVLAMNRVLPENLNNEMMQHKGRQYWLEDSWPKPVLGSQVPVIPRQQRKSYHQSSVTGLYWVADGMVAQAPSLLSVLQTRMQNSLLHLEKAFRALEDLTELDITDGYKWNKEYLSSVDQKETNSVNKKVVWEGRADKNHLSHFLDKFRKEFEPVAKKQQPTVSDLKRTNESELDRDNTKKTRFV